MTRIVNRDCTSVFATLPQLGAIWMYERVGVRACGQFNASTDAASQIMAPSGRDLQILL